MMEKKILISHFSLILLSVLFLVFLVWPKYSRFLELKKTVSKLEGVLQSYKEYFNEIEKTISKIKEREEELVKIKSALPSDPQVGETLNFFQKSASESGLLLRDVSFSVNKPEDEKLGELKIKLLLSGEYESLKNFLKKVEKSSRLIEIENISFSGEAPFNFELSLKAFFIQK